MPVNPSSARFAFDGDLVLRARGLSAVTATTATNALLLDRLSAYWNTGDFAQNLQTLAVVEVEASPTGGATHTAAVQVGTGAGFANPTDLFTVSVANNAAGVYLLPFTRERIAQVLPAADRIRVNFTFAAGTSPTAQFNAFLAQVLGR